MVPTAPPAQGSGAPLTAGYNLFVISAYVLAAASTYGYVYRMNGCSAAAVAAALTFSCSGFLVTHVPFTSINHSVAWLPLILWSIDEIVRGGGGWWMAVAAAGTACCILAGHAQMALHVVAVALIYALVKSFEGGQFRWRSLTAALFGLSAGILLSGIQIVPTIELAGLSVRQQHIPYKDFTFGALPLSQVLSLCFPYGGDNARPLFGWNTYQETIGYVGWLPFLLMLAAAMRRQHGGVALRFWMATLVAAVVLSADGTSPSIAQLTYSIPVYNTFRISARHLLEFAMAAAAIVGILTADLRAHPIDKRYVWSFAGAAFSLCGALLIALALQWPEAPWSYEVGLGLLRCWLTIAAVCYLLACRHSRIRVAHVALVLAVIVDVVAVGESGHWATWQCKLPSLEPIPLVGNRIATMSGTASGLEGAKPNTSQMFGAASVSGYNPLLLNRYHEALDVDTYGNLSYDILDEAHRALDILGARYVLQNRHGLNLLTGMVTQESNDSFEFPVSGRPADRMSVVSYLAGSTSVRDVADITVTRVDGSSECVVLQAGRDVLHLRNALPIKHISFRWLGSGNAFLVLSKLTLQDGLGNSWPVPLFADTTRWRCSDDLQGMLVSENLRAMPLAWLVDCAVSLPPADILAAVRTSRLRGGQPWDPAREVLVETALSVLRSGSSVGQAQVLEMRPGYWHVHTQAAGSRVLVISENAYPGWKARVDGTDQPVLTVDYILKGVLLSAGEHDVRLYFAPVSLHIGLGITLAGALLLALAALWLNKRSTASLRCTTDWPS